jgi:hypothetical protein
MDIDVDATNVVPVTSLFATVASLLESLIFKIFW